jgi:hypothetical protein
VGGVVRRVCGGIFTGYSPCKNVIAGMWNAAGARRLVIQEEDFTPQARSAK